MTRFTPISWRLRNRGVRLSTCDMPQALVITGTAHLSRATPRATAFHCAGRTAGTTHAAFTHRTGSSVEHHYLPHRTCALLRLWRAVLGLHARHAGSETPVVAYITAPAQSATLPIRHARTLRRSRQNSGAAPAFWFAVPPFPGTRTREVYASSLHANYAPHFYAASWRTERFGAFALLAHGFYRATCRFQARHLGDISPSGFLPLSSRTCLFGMGAFCRSAHAALGEPTGWNNTPWRGATSRPLNTLPSLRAYALGLRCAARFPPPSRFWPVREAVHLSISRRLRRPALSCNAPLLERAHTDMPSVLPALGRCVPDYTGLLLTREPPFATNVSNAFTARVRMLHTGFPARTLRQKNFCAFAVFLRTTRRTRGLHSSRTTLPYYHILLLFPPPTASLRRAMPVLWFLTGFLSHLIAFLFGSRGCTTVL